ncbi:hypothetical protein ACSSNL_03400 [Thalassobius sp. S69A]|uniref:hypothetical protein n=1 Tax=unclassified Thalassovita TaxID=2619711 RepID=UPI003C7A2A5E
MDTQEHRYTSGLVFLASRNCDTLELSASLQRVLEANGHRICGVQVQSETQVQVISDILTLELTVPAGEGKPAGKTFDTDLDTPQDIIQSAGLVIEIALTQPPEKGAAPTKRATQATLASLTCQMAVWLEPDYIRWLNEDTLLDTADFVKAVARVMPRRVTRKDHKSAPRPVAHPMPPMPMPQAQMALASGPAAAPVRPIPPEGAHTARPAPAPKAARFPDVDLTSRRLEQEYDTRNRDTLGQADLHELSDLRSNFHDEDAALEAAGIASARNTVARMATWFVAITVGIFSLPLAAFLMVCNLFRGEDFRLSAQALSLTGLFTALNANGATAEVAQILSKFTG